MTRITIRSIAVPLALAFLISSPSAEAYIGPGAGLTAIGTVVALLGGLLLAVVGFVWYPVKRLLKRRGKARAMAKVPETRGQSANQADADSGASKAKIDQ